jgi:hypothetical protein
MTTDENRYPDNSHNIEANALKLLDAPAVVAALRARHVFKSLGWHDAMRVATAIRDDIASNGVDDPRTASSLRQRAANAASRSDVTPRGAYHWCDRGAASNAFAAAADALNIVGAEPR